MPKPPLVEGVDYYVEDGKLVLSGAYHLKRGYCCNSRCKYCPYRAGAEASPTIVITGLASLTKPGSR